MILYMNDIKRVIDELRKIEDPLDLMDFVRNEFMLSYSDIFEESMEVEYKSSFDHYFKDYDFRRYTLYLFKITIRQKYKVDLYDESIERLKLVIFYEDILTLLPKDKYEKENYEIYEARNVYDFFKSLTYNKPCKLVRFQNALKILKIENLKQEIFDDDEYHIMQDYFTNNIVEKYLLPFINTYYGFLSK